MAGGLGLTELLLLLALLVSTFVLGLLWVRQRGASSASPHPALISFACPTCSRAYRVASDKAGKATKCPACGEQMRVPPRNSPPEMGKIGDAQLTGEREKDCPPAVGPVPRWPFLVCGTALLAMVGVRVAYPEIKFDDLWSLYAIFGGVGFICLPFALVPLFRRWAHALTSLPSFERILALARRRPELAAGVGMLALLVVSVVVFGLTRLARGYPEQGEVYNGLLKHLPPGMTKFEVTSYDRKEGKVRFEVGYADYGDPVGVVFEVSRYPKGAMRKGDTVYVTPVRIDLRSMERHRLADYTFEDGRMVDKRVLGARAGEGQWLEQTAAQLDQAARKAY